LLAEAGAEEGGDGGAAVVGAGEFNDGRVPGVEEVAAILRDVGAQDLMWAWRDELNSRVAAQ
jgi:hypothetical protein